MTLTKTYVIALLASVVTLSSTAPAPAPACALPSTYKWKSTAPLAESKQLGTTLREYTHVPYNGSHLVYATTYKPLAAWGSMNFDLFNDWSAMNSTVQNKMAQSTVAPSVFYFAPRKTWVIIYQWGATTFSYKTASNPLDANGWSGEQVLFSGGITESDIGPIDPVVIGDEDNMYLFFSGDNGNVYRSSLAISKFPGSFGTTSTVVLTDKRANLFEGVQVYTIGDAADKKKRYLMIVEAVGPLGRYFRSFTAAALDGTWTAQAATEDAPFAGRVNSDASWTADISQAEILRSGPDQTRPVDLCKLQVLYQGKVPNQNVYEPVTYLPVLLTLSK